MTRIESNTTRIDKPAAQIFSFLSNFNNFEKLMPEQVTNWKSSEEECSFTIAGMATLGMKIVEKKPNSLIRIVRNGTAPFDFTLTTNITEQGNESDVQLVFDADLNPMLKMMAVRPLGNFLNMLVERLKTVPI